MSENSSMRFQLGYFKYLILLIGTLTSAMGFGASIQGYIVRDTKGVFLRVESTPGNPESSVVYTLSSPSTATLIYFGRLENGDFVSASGILDSEAKVAMIQSIDYVGLNKILGLWYSKEKVFDFSSYTDLHLYSNAPSVKNVFRYSMAPSKGNDWTLFLSDTSNKRTLLATIRFSKSFATLKLIDSETGLISQSFRLYRRGASNAKSPSNFADQQESLF